MNSEQNKEQKCPKCGSSEVIPIHYGKPNDEGLQRAKRGEIILGGCRVNENPKRHACKKCNNRW